MKIVPVIAALLSLLPAVAQADPLIVNACGPNLASRIAEFRTMIGNPVNAALPGQQPAGRREINWDGVPATVTNTNAFPPAFFNTNSPRGLVMSSGGTGLRVSDNNFADVNATYATQFATFTPAKSIAVVGGNTLDVSFRIAGLANEAGVRGFGVVFSDVDVAGSATLEFFNGNISYGRFNAPARCDGGGLSFVGAVWNENERITRVHITSGSGSLGVANDVSSGGSADLVVMDDFIYGEPSPVGTVLTARLLGTEEVGGGDPDGTGLATIAIDEATGTIFYTIATTNVDTPKSAHIHTGTAGTNGGIVLDFAPVFANGIATGQVVTDAGTIDRILGNPGSFYVNVHNESFPAGAIRGQLASRAVNATRLIFPVVGHVAGAAGTEYRSDVRLVNVSGFETDVLLEYYASGTAANSTPTATTAIHINAGEQAILDNVVMNLFAIESGTGALRVISARPLFGTARIYNDQRAANNGTFGGLTLARDDTGAPTRGILPMLGNQPAGSRLGYRTNIGWFNHQDSTANVTFRAHDNATGRVIATSQPRAIAPFSQLQVPLTTLFPALTAIDNLYVTFDTDYALFVYASVVDNVNGDGTYIPAQQR